MAMKAITLSIINLERKYAFNVENIKIEPLITFNSYILHKHLIYAKKRSPIPVHLATHPYTSLNTSSPYNDQKKYNHHLHTSRTFILPNALLYTYTPRTRTNSRRFRGAPANGVVVARVLRWIRMIKSDWIVATSVRSVHVYTYVYAGTRACLNYGHGTPFPRYARGERARATLARVQL